MATAPTQATTPSHAFSVAEALAALHEHWFRRVHQHLHPLLTVEADRWDRWPAARFLGDQFDDWLGHERELVQSLARCLPASSVRRLEQSAADLVSICQELDQAGRRKGDGETRTIARRFFARLELWRTEVETELSGIQCDQLTDGERRVLHHLEVLAGQSQ